jgi:hypothetical protein
MRKITDPAQVSSIADPDIRHWISLRFSQLFPDVAYGPDEHGYFLVVEAGDTLESIEQAIGVSILDDFSYDILEAHDGSHSAGCYEMVFVTNDDGYFVSVWIPKASGIDGNLLSMLAENAVPTMELT